MSYKERILSFIKEKRAYIKPLVIGLIGIVIIFATAGGGGGSTDYTEDDLTRQVREFCEAIDGVGECRVIISYERGSDGYFSSGEKRVMAVAVACRGASSARVREALTDLLTTVFEIGANRVSIFKLE